MADKKQVKKDPRKRKTTYEELISFDDDKINVLILGTSGCGKSTLINSILEVNDAPTGNGAAVTKDIKVYQNDSVPFRMIDTVGFEYGFLKQNKIKHDLASFSKEGVKSKDVEKLIHMIWFCISGTSKRISPDVLSYIRTVSKDWENAPLFIVLTKSYSEVEIEENVNMVKAEISNYNLSHKRNPILVKEIIPIVAMPYKIDEATVVPQRGLETLIEKTNIYAPEARKIANSAIKELDLKIKQTSSNTVVIASTTAAATVGAAPIPAPDATVLVPLQMAMMHRLSKIYGLEEKSYTNDIIDMVIKIGATTMAGKALLQGIKMIPGLNIAGAVLNATVAGVITFAAGEVAQAMFEKTYTGEIDTNVDWEKEIKALFENYLPSIISKLNELNKGDKQIGIQDIIELLLQLIGWKKPDEENTTKKE